MAVLATNTLVGEGTGTEGRDFVGAVPTASDKSIWDRRV